MPTQVMQITLTDQDVDALTRLAIAEAQSIKVYIDSTPGPWENDGASAAYGSVVESILNRVAADSWYGDSVQGVINKRSWSDSLNKYIYQYTPLENATGNTWEGLPPPNSTAKQAVIDHINYLIGGGQTLVGPSTHYVNPTEGGTGPGWRQWGAGMSPKYVIGANPFDNAATLDLKDESVPSHVFGNADLVRPKTYELSYDGHKGLIDPNWGDNAVLPKDRVSDPTSDVPDMLNPIVGMQVGNGSVSFPQGAMGGWEPLVLDLDGDGAHSSNLGWVGNASTTYFDMDNDGFAERTAWVSSGDGLLAIDSNGNGTIDNQSELFGNDATYADGFAKLAQYDSNGDNQITALDTAFSSLKVWVDGDSDGVTDAGELKTLSELGITQISVNATAQAGVVDNENAVAATGSFTMNGQTREIADMWFRLDQTNTAYVGDVTLDFRTFYMPNVKGTGTLMDLRIAMSKDEILLTMVQNLATTTTTSSFANMTALDTQVRDILFRWAGVDTIAADAVFHGLNARQEGFIEKITGEPLSILAGLGPDDMVGFNVPSGREVVFARLFNQMKSLLLTQVIGDELFEGASYNLVTGEMSAQPVISTAGFEKINADLAAYGDDWSGKQYYLLGLNNYLIHVKSPEDFTASEVAGLETIWQAQFAQSWYSAAINAFYTFGWNFAGTEFSDYLHGTENAGSQISGLGGDDYIHGGHASDQLYGGDGNDHLYGDKGQDVLYGGEGNDTLEGGENLDYLYGGAGDDTYIYTSGTDTIWEESGIDKIVFDSAYQNAVVTFARDPNAEFALNILVNGQLAVVSTNQFHSDASRVEQAVLPDGTVVDLTQFGNVTGTNDNDTFVGLDLAYLQDDAIYVEAGNDTLQGGLGNDLLMGGYGNDTYIYNSGDGADFIKNDYDGQDVISFGSGILQSGITLERKNQGLTDDSGQVSLDMLIKYNGNTIITVMGQFGWSTIETLQFAGGGSINLLAHSYTTNGTENGEYIYGISLGGAGDVINAFGGMDTIHAGDGNDIISGGNDMDWIHGEGGNDTIWSGTGDDYVYAGSGDDIVYYESGFDRLSNDGGTDIVKITDTSVTLANLSVQRDSVYGNALDILINGTAAFRLENQFNWYGWFEKIELANGTSLNLLDIQYTTIGTENGEYVYGVSYGGNPNDILVAGGGDDTVYAGLGNDMITGGTGNDALYGDGGDDTYIIASGDGIDTIYDTQGNDTISFGAGFSLAAMTYARGGSDGNDLEIRFSGNLVVNVDNYFYEQNNIETIKFSDNSTYSLANTVFVQTGTSGTDYLAGHNGIDSLSGLGGDDYLYGFGGNDLLTGGLGNDTLDGGTGNDTYYFSTGDGQDIVYDASGSDLISLGSGITAANVRFEKQNYDLNIYYGTSDKITLANQFYDDAYATTYYDEVETLRLADGTTFNLLGGLTFTGTSGSDGGVYGISLNDTLVGLAGDDYLYGFGGNDTLNGGTGNDYLEGGVGNDTYVFNIGDGEDRITDISGTADLITLGSGITAANVRFEKQNYDLNIYYGTSDKITLANQFYDDAFSTTYYDEVETLKLADGTTFNLLGALTFTGTSGSDGVYGISLNDALLGLAGDDSLYGQSGNDTLDGGTGNDLLDGGIGNDTYQFSTGDGEDRITDISGTADLITLGSGITAANVRFEKSNYDLNIYYGTSDKITVYSQFYDDTFSTTYYDEVETLKLADGTTFNLLGALTFTGTSGSDGVYGISLNDALLGLAGDDSLYGQSGNDTLDGGTGNDLLDGGDGVDTASYANATSSVTVSLALTSAQDTGGYGTDTLSSMENLIGSSYADTLTGDINANSLTGGAGNDVLDGGDGTDTAVFSGAIDNYSFTNMGSFIRVSNTSGTDGADDLYNIEKVLFANNLKLDLSTLSSWIFGTSSGNNYFDTEDTHVITAIMGGGNDQVYAYGGDDVLAGGSGNDTLRGHDGNDGVYGGLDNDILYGGRGDDILYGELGDDQIFGNEDDDLINGGDGIDTLWGEGGNDTINAGAGDDIKVYGGDGNDTIHGDDGNDIISGEEGLDLIYGDAGNDKLYGRQDADVIYGGSGNDELYGDFSENDAYSSDDTLYGDAGTDTLRGGNGNDALYGGADNDTLFGNNGDDILDGGDGNDILRGGAGDDVYVLSKGSDNIADDGGASDVLRLTNGIDLEDLTFTVDPGNSNNLLIAVDGSTTSTLISSQNSVSSAKLEYIELEDGFRFSFKQFVNWVRGSSGSDIQNGTAGDDIIVGFGGNDTIQGASGSDTLITGSGADTLVGGTGNDSLSSGDGNDLLYGGEGSDSLYGGTGNDTYFYTEGTDEITDAGGSDTLDLADTINVEDVTFSVSGNDLELTIGGNSANRIVLKDQMLFGAGLIENLHFNDGTMFNLANFSSWIRSGASGGTVSGTSAADFMLGSNVVDDLRGLDENDTIYGLAGSDAIQGGKGDDIIHAGSDNDGNEGNIPEVSGGDGNDIIYGDGGNDKIKGDAGNDTIYGGADNDFLEGGTENDTLYGNEGIDSLYGGAGDDTLDGGDGDDVLSAGENNDTLYGGYHNDSMYGGNGNDTLYGQSGDDSLKGDAGTDTLDGGAGDDIIYGGTENDTILGSTGNDTLYGDAGNDSLDGGNGLDYFFGGAGSDVFHFTSSILDENGRVDDIDRIKDWGTGSTADLISLEGLLVGYDPVTSAIGDFLHSSVSGSDTVIGIDRDGAGTVYVMTDAIRIEGKTGLDIQTLIDTHQLQVA